MALSGSLKEFELADIFQLIGQQKKTGKLVLRDGTAEAYCLFNRGLVVAAGSKSCNFTTVLSKYLTDVKKYPEAKVREFVDVCKGSPAMFADVVKKIQYVSDDEIEYLSQSSTEDLACALFFWHSGDYFFQPMTAVSEHIAGSSSFTTDALAMEAMRRADEWQRMQGVIDRESVPVVADPLFYAMPEDAAPSMVLSNPASYVLSKLDGSRCVGDLIEECYLLEYSIFEIIFGGLQSGTVRLLSAGEIARSARVRKRTEPAENAGQVTSVSLAAIVSGAAVILMFFAGVVIIPRTLFAQRREQAILHRNALHRLSAVSKTTIAELFYRAREGKWVEQPAALVEEDLLDDRDLHTEASAGPSVQ